jgi:multiple sugar transport system substrate-binding protein
MAGNLAFQNAINRRGFLGGAAAAAAALSLGDSARAQGAGERIKFWDMVWGTGQSYTETAKAITASYSPAVGSLGVDYQSIPWANWYQTFASAGASGTTPAVSSGAAYLPFYFMDQGLMAPADDLLAGIDKSGKNDFLPGLVDSLRTDSGLAAMPWSIDLRVLWFRKSLLEKAGADVPTDWQSFIKAGEALQKSGIVGLGLAGGNMTPDGLHTVNALLINNGGGFFSEDGKPDCITDRNIETLDFLNELVRKEIIDPYAVSYSFDNLTSDWLNGHIAMGFGPTGHAKAFPTEAQSDIVVASPLTGPHGDKGTVYYINPLMMFKTTPSQASSEEFLAHYLDNLHVFWEKGVNTDLPVKKSITELPVIQNDANLVKSINEWQPIGRTTAARSKHAFAALNAVDGGAATMTLVQQIFQAQMKSKEMLEGLQVGLERAMKS